MGLLFVTPLYASSIVPNATHPANTQQLTQKSTATGIIKSLNDKRDYAFATLPNGLKLLVISDKDVQRSAVSVDVKVGSGNDPKAFPGLAHFLEHMLFLGTDKNPTPDAFMQYITQHGGHNNAFTALHNTNYFFDIDPDYLKPALAEFSRFFIAPLMTAEYVDRERHAVDAEYHFKLKEAYRRNMDVFKQAMNPNHPFARFHVGNLDTLPAKTVRPALLAFYKKYYSADRMAVVIIGKENTATLLKWGKAFFADVPKRVPFVSTKIKGNIFAGKPRPILIENQSLRSDKTLDLRFMLPTSKSARLHKVFTYLAYHLGYEGENGLADTLKKMGYISQLQAGVESKIGREKPFIIQMVLTDKGYQNRNAVLAVVFHYLDLMRQDKQGKARYEALAKLAKMDFDFQEKTQAIDDVVELAERLNANHTRDILTLDAIYKGYDKKQILRDLNLMTPKHAIVQLSAPDLHFTERTHYYHVPYAIKPLDIGEISLDKVEDKKVLNAMQLPQANPFIAENVQMQKGGIKAKMQTLPSGIQLFFKQDTTFNVPRSHVIVALQPTVALSLKERTALSLWVRELNEEMVGRFYQAGLAGLHGAFDVDNGEINLSLMGYQQKMPLLLGEMLQNLENFSKNRGVFERVKNQYRQDLENVKTLMPYKQTIPYLNKYILPSATLAQDRLKVLASIDEATIHALQKKLLANLSVRIMVYGNNTFQEAENLASRVASHLQGSHLQHPWRVENALVVKKAITEKIQVNHQDSAVSYYLQGEKGNQALAEVALLTQMLKSPFFNELRTEKQLGYVVSAHEKSIYLRAGLNFVVESPRANSLTIVQNIEDFTQQFAKGLTTLTEKEFLQHKAILRARLLQKAESLGEASSRYWEDIMLMGKPISYRQALVKALDDLTKAQFVQDMQAFLTQNKPIIIEAIPTQTGK